MTKVAEGSSFDRAQLRASDQLIQFNDTKLDQFSEDRITKMLTQSTLFLYYCICFAASHLCWSNDHFQSKSLSVLSSDKSSECSAHETHIEITHLLDT